MKHAIPAYLLSAGAALAHAGHDEAVVQGDLHWLTMGDHLIVVVLTVAALGLGLRAVLRHRAQRRAPRT